MTDGKQKTVPSVLVDCQGCGTLIEVDSRTFDLAHQLPGDGGFRCEACRGTDD